MKITAENNLISYALTEMRSFEELPPYDLDSVILSWLSYIRIPPELIPETNRDGLPLRSLLRSEYFAYMTERTIVKYETVVLLSACCASPRFRHMKIRYYQETLDLNKEQQFAAMSFELNQGLLYLSFRGTDSTVIGWKEDFNMVLEGAIPSQQDAVAYVNQVAGQFPGTLLLGGHSKGGNLAVYAAAQSQEEVQDRIWRVYSHDGPGFLPEQLSQMNLEKLQDKIIKILPQASLIGILFQPECDCVVIRSNAKGFGQHNAFSWIVEDGHFVVQDQLKLSSRLVDNTLSQWVERLSVDERKRFIDVVFRMIESTGEFTFQGFGSNIRSNLHTMLVAAKDMDDDTRKFMFHVLRELAVSGIHTGTDLLDDGKLS